MLRGINRRRKGHLQNLEDSSEALRFQRYLREQVAAAGGHRLLDEGAQAKRSNSR